MKTYKLSNDGFKKTELTRLKDLLAIQMQDGMWNRDAYMHGLTNGLILAIATIEGSEPHYMDSPEEWEVDRIARYTQERSCEFSALPTSTSGTMEQAINDLNKRLASEVMTEEKDHSCIDPDTGQPAVVKFGVGEVISTSPATGTININYHLNADTDRYIVYDSDGW